MPTTTLNIPILVQPVSMDGENLYHVKPLFLDHPIVLHRRYGEAVSKFRQEVKRRFRGISFTRSNMNQLLWFKFAPDVQLHHFHYSFSIGSNYINGLFAVATFSIRDHLIAVLPALGNFMFIVPKKKGEAAQVEELTYKVVVQLVKKYRKQEGDDFDPDRFYAHKREFLTSVQQDISFKEAKFQFEEDSLSDFLAVFRDDVNFDGGEEVERVGYDIGARYPHDLRRAFYRDDLVRQLYDLLFRRENTPLVILGRNGVGRHTAIEEVMWRYMESEGGKEWQRHYFWHINPNRVIAGMSIVGHWEKRFEAILNFVISPPARKDFPDKILIDNPVALLRVGKSASGSLTLSSVLKPYLEKRLVQVAIIATPEEWKIVQETDRGFADLFQIFRLGEPDLPTALRMVFQNRRSLEAKHGCNITVPAINQLFTIQRNFLKNKALPGSVMKLLDQLAAKYSREKIDAIEVREEFKAFSGMEERIFDEHTKLQKDEIRELLGRELVGQPHAVKVLADSIHLIKAKLTDRSKPLASFLFIGPTGVGKTHAAKLLCKCLMGDEQKLLRFDMNEYIDDGALHRLIGDIHNPEGHLTGKVRYQPFGVVLLDEIEKAHPKIHDLLLQVLDDARLTDSLGRTVDFSNMIIVMTSNLGAREAASRLGYGSENQDQGAIYRKAVENFFRPEMVNRIEQITIFNPLNFEQIQKIAQLQIRELLKRDGFVRRTTIVNVSPDALGWVARRGFDVRMGGRALKRQIERDLTLLSAQQLIKTTSESPVILDISFKDDRLVPHIFELEFSQPKSRQWLPELPGESNIGRYFYQLLKRVERIEAAVSLYDQNTQKKSHLFNVDKASADWQYYAFKEKLAQLKEDIQFKQLKYKERQMTMTPVIPFRLKRIFLEGEPTGRARKEMLRDRLFQSEALQELREEYRFGRPEFNSAQTDYLISYLNVSFLEKMLDGFLSNTLQKLCLHFESCVTHSGQDEIEWLMERYKAVFEKMDLIHEFRKEEQKFTIEGHNVLELLKGEAGIHLFYISHSIPVPIRLSVTGNGEIPDANRMEVIRIYDGSETMTDLRTGYSNTMNLTADEFKLLLYGGMESSR